MTTDHPVALILQVITQERFEMVLRHGKSDDFAQKIAAMGTKGWLYCLQDRVRESREGSR